MQILVQVLTSETRSFRDIVIKDKKLNEYGLKVVMQKKSGRSHGWSKLRSTYPEFNGAINIQWESSSRMLLCRVVTRGYGKANFIIGSFVDYLLARYSRKIEAVNIIPR
jgi:hypothetical protein